VWRIGRERILLVGGPAALLLQLAHPLVAAAVADHSDFRNDPFHRLRATLEPTLTITFGDLAQARAAADRVRAKHSLVQGRLRVHAGRFEAGSPYAAADPELALWVHCTLVHVALLAYDRFIRPLADPDRDAYYQEAARFAALFDVTEALLPPGFAEFQAYMRSMISGPSLAVTPASRALAREILNPPLRPVLRVLSPGMRAMTAGLLPPRLREEFGLPWGAPQRAAYRALSVTLRSTVPALPPASRFWPHYRTAVRRTRRYGCSRRAS